MRKTLSVVTGVVAGLLAAAPLALAQHEIEGTGQAIVTVLPKNNKQQTAQVSEQTLKVQVDGKNAKISNWVPLGSQQTGVELVLLIDGGARATLGREWDDITHFVQNLPPNVKVTLAYMENGGAELTGPLTADHAKAAQELHLPMAVPGYSASPYFCLSSLARHWPSNAPNVRREVIMITDGVDYYELHYDPEDPYVHAAMLDSVRAGLLVYSIYWKSNGPLDRTWYETDAGQNLLMEITQDTGGYSYWIGMGNPVTLAPYFDDFDRRLKNQYELDIAGPLHGKPEVETLKVKCSDSKVKATAPQRVSVVLPGGNAPA